MGKLSILLIIAIEFVTKQTCVVHAFFNFPAETDVIEEDGLEKGGNDHCLLKTHFYLKVIISDVCQKHTTEPG